MLSKKLIILLALTTAHRVQTYTKIKNINMNIDEILIKITDLVKTSKIGATQLLLVLPYFREQPTICPASVLAVYIDKTKPLRGNEDHLFISYKKPHKSVCSQTLSRWIKNTLQCCGIDISIFSGHSTRHAFTSRAHMSGISLDVMSSEKQLDGAIVQVLLQNSTTIGLSLIVAIYTLLQEVY